MADYVIDRALMGKPKEKYWISYIKGRIRNNKNFLGFISGQVGSGKTYSSLRMGEDLDSEFDIGHVVFSGLELMTLINSGKLKRGSVIIFEEGGIEMNAKNWASITNKMLNYLLQTFRHRGFILIMNSPYMDFVDSASKKLFHAEFRTIGIDYTKNEVLLKPKLLQYNSDMKKFYRKRLKVIQAVGKVPVSVWRIPKPSTKLIEEYEQKKMKYTTDLNARILRELTKADEKKNSGTKELTDIQENYLNLLKKGLTIKQIANETGRATEVIHHSLRLIRKKGYIITPIHQDRHVIGYRVSEPPDCRNDISDNSNKTPNLSSSNAP